MYIVLSIYHFMKVTLSIVFFTLPNSLCSEVTNLKLF